MADKNDVKAFEAYGITILKSSHSRVRIIKRKTDEPVIHGHKIWGSSLLLMDYFQQYQLIQPGDHVLDAGCGWGLTGIYAAHNCGARVTAIDADKSVFPYLDLHADVNNVQVATLQRRFEKLRIKDFSDHCLVFGGDVCFWDELVDIWYNLIGRAFRAGVERVVLADPGRTSFHDLTEKCLNRWGADSVEWSVSHPRPISGYILDIQNPGQ
ncbi:methyltransferase domain-containing protein [Endozoicomonas sp. Mp262]|uniref:class I SAM-dependent methyltransferase n=1 Tax=Endozoicomonas sp. Mp262 TaxID=2919499 RepID=UPI0021D7ECCA